MKKFYFLLLGLFLFSGVNAQIINIPDANFKNKLLASSQSNYLASDSNGNSLKIDANSNGQIEIAEALAVYTLNVSNENSSISNKITNLSGIENFINLRTLSSTYNLLQSVSISSLVNLTNFHCQHNQLTSLNLSGLTALTYMDISYNMLPSLNLVGLSNLEYLFCDNNQLNNVNVSGLINLHDFFCHQNLLTSLNLTTLSGLRVLSCSYNQLTNLDVSNSVNIEGVYFNNNQVNTFNFNNCVNIKSISASNNQLTSLDVSDLTILNSLDCFNNALTSLNVDGLNSLQYIQCQSNLLTSLNVNGLSSLIDLGCNLNQLTTLNIGGLTSLTSLYCNNNQLTVLDATDLINLSSLVCHSNQLNSLFLKNGKIDQINFINNPNLQYICADDDEIAMLQSTINSYGYACQVNSYCSFAPGGVYYTIHGEQKFDSNNNGCDAADIPIPWLKFSVSGNNASSIVISDVTGNFNLPVGTGTYSITPIMENPTYFTISPSIINVDFPTQSSPFNQNFCVSPNGIHPDLEVVLLSVNAARPGFDAKYKIIYKNKGNQVQSGSVDFSFNDALLDLVTVSPSTTSQTTNNLSWDFTNLLPFETREITLTLNVNSPMETPAVNNGDQLNFSAILNTVPNDETPYNNEFGLKQIVVGSFDPNDKTCLEGATISPAKVGDYVHYMIRFENTGTFPAENIVVKDMIDLAKFDINTLVPIKGSHSFVTNITSGNKVEFIFEGINLPFDDANNDGYVAFKIKTKPTLVLGNTFSNTASIYFDYNFPIVTNTATTTIAVLANQDFVFSNYFTVYPNPVKDILNITAKETIEVTSINIYNTLGQLVLVIPNAQNVKTVDVSGLTKGNYFIKINSDKGTSNTKFIKN